MIIIAGLDDGKIVIHSTGKRMRAAETRYDGLVVDVLTAKECRILAYKLLAAAEESGFGYIEITKP